MSTAAVPSPGDRLARYNRSVLLLRVAKTMMLQDYYAA
jgi:hypothetical protein